MMDPAISATASLFIGGLLLVAACHKLAVFSRFRATLAAYRLVAGEATGVLAGGAVLAELVLAWMTLSLGAAWQRTGVVGAIALLTLYAGAIVLNLARGNVHIDCGCLGFAGRAPRLTVLLAWRNAVLVAIAAVALVPVAQRPLTWLDLAAIAASLVSLALLYAGSDLAITLSRKESLA